MASARSHSRACALAARVRHRGGLPMTLKPMNPVEEIPSFYLDFTISALVQKVGTVADETIEQAREAVIEHLRGELNEALTKISAWGITFEIIDFTTQEVQQ